MNDDFTDFIGCLLQANVRFLIVGAYALAVHGVPRMTSDLDIWIDHTPENAARAWNAIVQFGTPVTNLGITVADLSKPEMVVQFGVPPNRIDVLTTVSGVEFGTAWAHRVFSQVGPWKTPYISREHFITNKRSTGRAKDLGDIEGLEG